MPQQSFSYDDLIKQGATPVGGSTPPRQSYSYDDLIKQGAKVAEPMVAGKTASQAKAATAKAEKPQPPSSVLPNLGNIRDVLAGAAESIGGEPTALGTLKGLGKTAAFMVAPQAFTPDTVQPGETPDYLGDLKNLYHSTIGQMISGDPGTARAGLGHAIPYLIPALASAIRTPEPPLRPGLNPANVKQLTESTSEVAGSAIPGQSIITPEPATPTPKRLYAQTAKAKPIKTQPKAGPFYGPSSEPMTENLIPQNVKQPLQIPERAASLKGQKRPAPYSPHLSAKEILESEKETAPVTAEGYLSSLQRKGVNLNKQPTVTPSETPAPPKPRSTRGMPGKHIQRPGEQDLTNLLEQSIKQAKERK